MPVSVEPAGAGETLTTDAADAVVLAAVDAGALLCMKRVRRKLAEIIACTYARGRVWS